ncbi:MAG: YciI family protein [Devosia sp.]|nr:YciI family protein [Devosia sp.]
MKFACLVYIDPAVMGALSKEEDTKLTDDSIDNDKDLARRGHLMMAHALQSTATAVTIRVRNGKMSATDGPFAETKEQLGGFMLIEARDMDEAIEIITATPMAKVASMEIRPFLHLEHS